MLKRPSKSNVLVLLRKGSAVAPTLRLGRSSPGFDSFVTQLHKDVLFVTRITGSASVKVNDNIMKIV